MLVRNNRAGKIHTAIQFFFLSLTSSNLDIKIGDCAKLSLTCNNSSVDVEKRKLPCSQSLWFGVNRKLGVVRLRL